MPGTSNRPGSKCGCVTDQWCVAALAIFFAAGTALAHVTLEVGEAEIGSFYKAVLRVPHGCDGAPTKSIRVDLPEGIIAAKPMPKPGWQVRTIKGAYAAKHAFHGDSLADGVREITWSGGELPDDQYDEFTFVAFVASELQPGMLYLPVVQDMRDRGEEVGRSPQRSQCDGGHELSGTCANSSGQSYASSCSCVHVRANYH